MPSISMNPMLVTNGAGLFSVISDGLVQGVVMDDPSQRNWLAGGVLAATETLPMWAGVGITESVGTPISGQLSQPLGSSIARATTLANLTGFSVTNQAHNGIITPQSEAPSVGVGMGVNFVRFGDHARVTVACDPSLISLGGGLVSQQVSWDFNLQRLIPYAPVEAANTFTAMSWASTNGGTVTATTTAAHGYVPGDDITISGVTPSAYNGDVTLLTGTTGSTIVYALPAGSSPGSVTVQGQINAGGGAVPCKIMQVMASNCMVIDYDATNNLVHWSTNGACAVILV